MPFPHSHDPQGGQPDANLDGSRGSLLLSAMISVHQHQLWWEHLRVEDNCQVWGSIPVEAIRRMLQGDKDRD